MEHNFLFDVKPSHLGRLQRVLMPPSFMHSKYEFPDYVAFARSSVYVNCKLFCRRSRLFCKPIPSVMTQFKFHVKWKFILTFPFIVHTKTLVFAAVSIRWS